MSKELFLPGSKSLYREARDKTIFSFVFTSHWVPAPQDLRFLYVTVTDQVSITTEGKDHLPTIKCLFNNTLQARSM